MYYERSVRLSSDDCIVIFSGDVFEIRTYQKAAAAAAAAQVEMHHNSYANMIACLELHTFICSNDLMLGTFSTDYVSYRYHWHH